MEPRARSNGAWVTRTRGIAALGLAAVAALGLGVTDRGARPLSDSSPDADVAMAASQLPPGFGHEARFPEPAAAPARVVAAAAPKQAVKAVVKRASRGERPTDQALPAWVPPVIDSTGIPVTVLAAYKHARDIVRSYNPNCHLSISLLGAIGRVESDHALGGYVDSRGKTLVPILGPRLDGHPGVKSISDSDGGLYDGDKEYDRAVGPMQFIPTTWVAWASDGNADKIGDPGNVYDAALAAGWYLCAGQTDLKDKKQFKAAVLRYNNSLNYYKTVRTWAEAYRQALMAVPDTKDAAEAERRAKKAAAERAAELAAKAAAAKAAAAKQRAVTPAAEPAPLSPAALEPMTDGGRPAETGTGKAAPQAPIVPTAPRPAPAKPGPVVPAKPAPAVPAKPAPVGETSPSSDERRDQKPAANGEAVGNALNGLTAPKGGTPPAAGPTEPGPPPTGSPRD